MLQQHYGWWVGVPATLAAGYVATARVHDAKHYLSDVIFGGALGIAAQRTVMLSIKVTAKRWIAWRFPI